MSIRQQNHEEYYTLLGCLHPAVAALAMQQNSTDVRTIQMIKSTNAFLMHMLYSHKHSFKIFTHILFSCKFKKFHMDVVIKKITSLRTEPQPPKLQANTLITVLSLGTQRHLHL
jgi:hypothetical protein